MYLKERLKENGGKWLGFKTGEEDRVVVRIRRTSCKYFYLPVQKYLAENKVIVSDKIGKESGVAIRFNKNCFSLEPDL